MQVPRPLPQVGRPLVSVVTPALNSARFIVQCIESVLSQDYPNVEHIVQDGGSIDGTVELLQQYGKRIDWESERDSSQAEGLDKALKRSNGDILIVINADDLLLPHAARWAVTQMVRFPDCAVVYGDVHFVNEGGEIIGKHIGPEYDFPRVLCVERVIPAQAAFIRRSALEKVGLGTDPTLDTCPDFEMFVRLGLRFPMRHARGFVTKYRSYRREMDGRQPRSVDRFVRAKELVMSRAFQNPAAGSEIKKMERRARAGLYLWASEEARVAEGFEGGWEWYSRALGEFPPADRSLIRAALIQASPIVPFFTRSRLMLPLRLTVRNLAGFLARHRRLLGLGIAPRLVDAMLKLVVAVHAVGLRLSDLYKSLVFGEFQADARMARRRGRVRRLSSEPSMARALFVGLGLVGITPGVRRVARALNRTVARGLQVPESGQPAVDSQRPQ